MKTPIFPISLASLSIISLILLSAFMTSNGSTDNNSSGKSGFVQTEQKESSLQNLNYFEKRETGIEYKLTYGWKDYTNKEHSMDFPISKKQLVNAENEFGYYPEELRKYLEERLQGMRGEMILALKKFTRQSRKAPCFSNGDIRHKFFFLFVSQTAIHCVGRRTFGISLWSGDVGRHREAGTPNTKAPWGISWRIPEL